jgi:hypothetical protein
MITCACGGAPQAGPSPVTAPATATLAAPPTIVDGVTGQPVVATIEDLMVARGGRGGAQFSAAEPRAARDDLRPAISRERLRFSAARAGLSPPDPSARSRDGA